MKCKGKAEDQREVYGLYAALAYNKHGNSSPGR